MTAKPEDALVEQVARAICEQCGYDPDRLEPGDDPYHEEEGYPSPCIDGYNRKDEPCHFVWRRYDKPARAAIEASGITTLLERERRAGWQPAETAPRDGTHILVCSGDYGPHWGFDQSPPLVVHFFPDPDDPGFYMSRGIVQDSYNDAPQSFEWWRQLGDTPVALTGDGV